MVQDQLSSAQLSQAGCGFIVATVLFALSLVFIRSRVELAHWHLHFLLMMFGLALGWETAAFWALRRRGVLYRFFHPHVNQFLFTNRCSDMLAGDALLPFNDGRRGKRVSINLIAI
jgi:hypothetical protein